MAKLIDDANPQALVDTKFYQESNMKWAFKGFFVMLPYVVVSTYAILSAVGIPVVLVQRMCRASRPLCC